MDFLSKVANQALDSKKQEQPPQQQASGAEALLGKLGNFAGNQQQQPPQQQQQSGADGLLDKLHGLAGGGPESEKKEDHLDKGAFSPKKCIDWVQENVFKQGAQDNESAAEQAKDKLIADTVRDQYKKATGKEFPIKEKEEKSSSGLGALGSKFGL
ncbi:hypothetical protein OQA88_7867 [Cercophora sp. LCS_1]